MNIQKLLLLNAPVLTAHGDFRFELISLESARDLVKEFTQSGKPVESAIGHEATASILSDMLGIEVAANRIGICQQPGESAIVFKMRSRLSEGRILNRKEIENLGFEFGLLTRLK